MSHRPAASIARAALALPVAAVFAFGACGDDEAGDQEAFCAAELAAEAAVAAEAPDADAAVEELRDRAPEEVRDAVEAVLANAESGAGDPAFDEPYAELIGFMREHCELQDLTVSASENRYDGLDGELQAGPTVISMTNDGDEDHAALLVRVDAGSDATAEELASMNDRALGEAVEVVSGTFLPPGASTFMPVDLTPGRYLLLCPVPNADGTTHAQEGQFVELVAG
jgi:hypothetical protein